MPILSECSGSRVTDGYTVARHDEGREVCLRLDVCLVRQSQRRHLPWLFLNTEKQKDPAA